MTVTSLLNAGRLETDVAEVRAIKIEIAAIIRKRMTDDRRPPDLQVATCLHALSESLSELIFSAAHSEKSAESWLSTLLSMIRTHWQFLARRQAAEDAAVGRVQ